MGKLQGQGFFQPGPRLNQAQLRPWNKLQDGGRLWKTLEIPHISSFYQFLYLSDSRKY
jgi:hypothetical protein